MHYATDIKWVKVDLKQSSQNVFIRNSTSLLHNFLYLCDNQTLFFLHKWRTILKMRAVTYCLMLRLHLCFSRAVFVFSLLMTALKLI